MDEIEKCLDEGLEPTYHFSIFTKIYFQPQHVEEWSLQSQENCNLLIIQIIMEMMKIVPGSSVAQLDQL